MFNANVNLKRQRELILLIKKDAHTINQFNDYALELVNLVEEMDKNLCIFTGCRSGNLPDEWYNPL